MRVLSVLVVLVCVSYAAAAARRGGAGEGCTAIKGNCLASNACSMGLQTKGLCPGSTVCCVDKCKLQEGGACSSSCSGRTVSGLCPGSSKCCVTGPVTPPPPDTGSIAGINALADSSSCVGINWTDRGKMPKAFLRGIGYTFAKAVCNPNRPDVDFMGKTATGSNDALGWYGSILKSKLGANTAGINTVRQLYTLMIGLGMRESSGQWCVGRDLSADFSQAGTAEAGLFQTSWNANARSSLLKDMFTKYSGNKAGCGIPSYTTGVTCSAKNLQNWGKPNETGYQWQKLTKDCPSFAAEYAGVLLRVNGGEKGEWGPLRKKVAEVRKECYDFLGSVQNYVAAKPAVCNALAL